jgi:hypothetical protein
VSPPIAPARKLRGAALALATGLLALSALEAVLAALGLPAPGLYAGDPGLYWTLRPSLDVPAVAHLEEERTFAVRTNALGLREEGDLPATGPWVLALGCSTTFGWGVAAEEAWPARLERILGVPVVNAGVPGHSTEQGKRFAEGLLARRPTVAVMGWIVRDAQLAPRPDSAARPTPWIHRTHLSRLLRGSLRPPSVAAPRAGVPRVDATAYAANLRELLQVARTQGTAPLLLAFPMVEPPEAHLQALRTLDPPVLAPTLPREAFFERDPVHLNASGHGQLAEALLAPVQAALQQAPSR